MPVFVLVEVVVLYCVWRFRMSPGEEHKDGPPIHGNTRLEIIWTAIPAIILVALCSYAYVVLTRHRGGRGRRDGGPRRRRAVHLDLLLPRPTGGKESPPPQLYLPVDRPVNFNVQSKDVLHDFWVPAFRHEDRRGAGHRHARYRVTPKRIGNVPRRLRRAVRPRPLRHAPDAPTSSRQDEFDEWLEERGERAASGGGGGGAAAEAGGGGGGARRQGALHRAQPAAAPATRWPTPARAATIGPDLDEVLQGKDAAFIRAVHRRPDAEIAAGLPGRASCRRTTARRSQPAEIDALVEYLAR